MAEIIVGPMTLYEAEAYLVKLMNESDAFHGGSRPVIGRLKTSYGYHKVIGVKSFDNSVYTRIDYDPMKGYHFNFINDNTGEKICIILSGMDKRQYEKYINRLTAGRSRMIIPPKRPNIPQNRPSSAYQYLEERRRSVDGYLSPVDTELFIMQYYKDLQALELLEMNEDNQISSYENNNDNFTK